MSTKSLISVIIPCYNSGKFVLEAAKSVFNQSYRPIELIFVNDGSSDDTLTLLQTIQCPSGISIDIITTPNNGAASARNTGLNKAKGEFIQFLDADDYLCPEKFEHQIKQFENNTDLVISDYIKMDSSLTLTNFRSNFSNIESDPLLYSIQKIITTLNPIYRKNIVKEIGGYDKTLSCAQDWEFHLRLFLSKPKIKYTEGYFTLIRQVNGSISSNYLKVLMQCADILIQKENEILRNKEIKEQHKRAIAKWFYEAAIYSTKATSQTYFNKSLFYDSKLSFLTRKKMFIKNIIGVSVLFKIDRLRNKSKQDSF